MSNGFTQVPNNIMEIVPRYKFTAAQFTLLLVVWRYTYGYHQDDHDFAISFLAKATGMDGRNVRRELNGLLEANVLLVKKEQTNNQARRIGFNQNYSDWVIEMRDSGKCLERANLTSQIEFGEGGFDLSGGGKFDLSGEGGFDPQEIKYLKKELNKDIYVEIIDYLNMKTGKRFSS
ncbi:replication protein, partial [Paenibacillus ehimensis]|uniref:replication protein n=1 Tax=Paenibacillus ehimensis TaxID=79264 RepID=UPI00055DD529